jgi:hypothetical protein
MTIRHRLLRPRSAAALGSAAALTALGALALHDTTASAETVTARQQVSANWSGYVVQDRAGHNFSSVSGSWVEPAVKPGAGRGFAAFWVGLGGTGQSSPSLEQVGTAAQTVDGQTRYYAWYELLPSAQVQMNLPIHPGDRMSGRVTVHGTSVTVSLSDHTTDRSVTRTLRMSDPDTSSAEWIAEAPAAERGDGSLRILSLADFGKITFSHVSATAGGHTGSLDDAAWSVERVALNPSVGSQFFGGDPAFASDRGSFESAGASAGRVSNGGRSFTVSYTAAPTGGRPSSTPASGYPGYRYPGYGYPGYGYPYPGYPYPGYSYPGYGYS